MLYQIDTGYACFGIIVENDKVIASAPIAKWTVGKSIWYVLDYFKGKRARIKTLTSTNSGSLSSGAARKGGRC